MSNKLSNLLAEAEKMDNHDLFTINVEEFKEAISIAFEEGFEEGKKSND